MTTPASIISPTPSPAFRAPSPFFRRNRILGRAPSPPTWACYEQIHSDYEGEFSCSDSDSERDDNDDDGHRSCSEDGEDYGVVTGHQGQGNDSAVVDSMDVDEVGDAERKAKEHALAQAKNKGKQKAVEDEQTLEPEEIVVTRKVVKSPRRRGRESYRRQPTFNPRPILTIQRSQGFVWNQDLFVPPYIKDRYIASTSPPNSTGFISTSASSTNSAWDNYEVEVVEIRVREGELNDIIP